jgi:hypothetical protein
MHMAEITAGLNAPEAARRLPVSALLEQLRQDVPESRVTFGWLTDYLRAHSPEVPILFLSLVGVVPGIALAVAVLLALLGLAMMFERAGRPLPAFIASQHLPSAHLVNAIDRTVPLFQWCERFTRTRERSLADHMRPIAGAAVVLLSATMLVPLPFTNVIPSLAIGFIAFASIEADSLLFSAAIAAALVSLAISAATIWALVGAASWVWR